MGPEVNTHSIKALEKQIEKGTGDTIKLKRARNSLLNISARVPPEILGYIFVWSLVWETYGQPFFQHFAGLRKDSYNFLLVCHHWSEVASRTPELWSFWGNTLQDWEKRHRRSGAGTPLDLVLDGGRCYPPTPFDQTLQDAVRGRVMQDTIREVHLASGDSDTLASIVSALTPGNGSAQNGNIGSIVWQNTGFPPVDVSNFFARSRLSKLRRLYLSGSFQISSWDHIASRTTLLTTLSLHVSDFPQTPILSTSQLFSILISNPNLRRLELSSLSLPDDSDGSTFQVPLHNLKMLSLRGEFRDLLGLLRQLILPEALDCMHLSGADSAVEGISQVLGPYIRTYFRRGPKFQGRLEVEFSYFPGSISITVDTVTASAQNPPSPAFTMVLTDLPPPGELEQLFADLITLIPKEYVVSFNADPGTELPEELLSMMPNIETLYLYGVELSKGFLQPNLDGPRANTKLLPSLRSLFLTDITLDDNDWSHLTTYLTHQTSDNQIISLEVISRGPHMPPEVENEIKGLVKELIHYEYGGVECGGSPSSCGRSTHDEDE